MDKRSKTLFPGFGALEFAIGTGKSCRRRRAAAGSDASNDKI